MGHLNPIAFILTLSSLSLFYCNPIMYFNSHQNEAVCCNLGLCICLSLIWDTCVTSTNDKSHYCQTLWEWVMQRLENSLCVWQSALINVQGECAVDCCCRRQSHLYILNTFYMYKCNPFEIVFRLLKKNYHHQRAIQADHDDQALQLTESLAEWWLPKWQHIQYLKYLQWFIMLTDICLKCMLVAS